MPEHAQAHVLACWFSVTSTAAGSSLPFHRDKRVLLFLALGTCVNQVHTGYPLSGGLTFRESVEAWVRGEGVNPFDGSDFDWNVYTFGQPKSLVLPGDGAPFRQRAVRITVPPRKRVTSFSMVR